MSFALIFDVAMACVLAFFAVRGLIRGFSGEVVELAGLFVALSCSWPLAQPAAACILEYFPDWSPRLVSLGCTVAIFFGVMLVFALINKLVYLIVRAADLSLIDHSMGVLIGALKTACLVLFLYGALTSFPILPLGWMGESYTMRGAAAVWPPVQKLLERYGLLHTEGLSNASETGSPSPSGEPVSLPQAASLDGPVAIPMAVPEK